MVRENLCDRSLYWNYLPFDLTTFGELEARVRSFVAGDVNSGNHPRPKAGCRSWQSSAPYRNARVLDIVAQRTLLQQPLRLRSPQRVDHLDEVRQKFQAIISRFAGFQAKWLNVHVDFALLQRIALPITIGSVRYPGIKI